MLQQRNILKFCSRMHHECIAYFTDATPQNASSSGWRQKRNNFWQILFLDRSRPSNFRKLSTSERVHTRVRTWLSNVFTCNLIQFTNANYFPSRFLKWAYLQLEHDEGEEEEEGSFSASRVERGGVIHVGQPPGILSNCLSASHAYVDLFQFWIMRSYVTRLAQLYNELKYVKGQKNTATSKIRFLPALINHAHQLNFIEK